MKKASELERTLHSLIDTLEKLDPKGDPLACNYAKMLIDRSHDYMLDVIADLDDETEEGKQVAIVIDRYRKIIMLLDSYDKCEV